MISISNVSKTYRGASKPALDGVSLEIEKGDFVFLVGASGSGKSSLLRLMLREEVPSKGDVFVLGENLISIPSRRVPFFRRKIGVVFQDFRLLPNKTVFQNVAFTLEVLGKSSAFISDAVPEVLKLVGLEEKADRLPSELSGGEQQRVAVARALINNPKVIFADEPSGNLDSTNAQKLHELFFTLRQELKQTIVVVTHNETLANMADRKLVMKDGLIA